MASSSKGGAPPSPPEPRTEQEVLARFQQLRQNINHLVNQLSELADEAAEHDLVIKQLEPMAAGRRCYRMIGDVLVERTVGETLPAVKRNREGLEGVMASLKQQLEAQSKALAAFQAKYKIRAAGGDGNDEDEDAGGGRQQQQKQQQKQQQAGGAAGGGKQAGVLTC